MRTMMVLITLLCLAGLVFLAVPSAAQEPLTKGLPNADKLGWRVGCQAYSFRDFTFFDAVDKVKALGMRYIEMYPGQTLSKEKPDIKVGHDMPKDAQDIVKAKLKEAGVTLVAYGVVGLPKDEAGCRKIFDFAKAMGIETIVAEPAYDAFEMLDKLCQEFNINIAIHNHPKPSPYWNPDKVLEVTKGCSKRIGSCADTGHWMRSGINPLEAIKKLEGRIITFHFKDLNEASPKAYDVPWGTGVCDVKAMLTEVKRQNLKALFSAEYEKNDADLMPNLAKCVENFEKVATELSK